MSGCQAELEDIFRRVLPLDTPEHHLGRKERNVGTVGCECITLDLCSVCDREYFCMAQGPLSPGQAVGFHHAPQSAVGVPQQGSDRRRCMPHRPGSLAVGENTNAQTFARSDAVTCGSGETSLDSHPVNGRDNRCWRSALVVRPKYEGLSRGQSRRLPDLTWRRLFGDTCGSPCRKCARERGQRAPAHSPL